MTSPDLPAELKAALDRKAEGLSQTDAARRAVAISENYRGGGGSNPIKTEMDALAYALARMPATYAAIIACLNALRDQIPAFEPQSLLDVGAGPGTASWAAAQNFETLAEFMALDANPALRSLALSLVTDSRLSSLSYERGEALKAIHDTQACDLVIASYVIGEIGEDSRASLVTAMWQKTKHILLIVEPGTPAGYERIIAARSQLISEGANVVAPCPHDDSCPLTPPDWCHFSQRLPRSRAHKHLKGADLPFEDERFSYVTLSRIPSAHRPARVLSQPLRTKVAVTAKLCTENGLKTPILAHRDKKSYAAARKWDWGDAVETIPVE